MIAAIWVGIAAFVAAEIYIRRKRKKECDWYFNTTQMQREIQALARCANELETLDNMLIDLRLCKPDEVQRAFRMEWQSVSGQNHSFDFFADGQNPSTEHLRDMAEAEREALNQEIIQRVFDLYKLAVLLSGKDEE